jgi:hypothetical protein
MSITLAWYAALPHVMYYEFTTPWTWHEYETAFAQELTLAAQLNGAIYDVIANITHGTPIPSSGGFSTLIHTIQQSPPNMGLIVLVGQSTLLKMFLITLNQIYPPVRDQLILVPTLEMAHQHIVEARQKTPENT